MLHIEETLIPDTPTTPLELKQKKASFKITLGPNKGLLYTQQLLDTEIQHLQVKLQT